VVLGLIQPFIQWILRAPSREVNCLGHEVDYSPLSSIKVKDGGVIPLLLCTPRRCAGEWRYNSTILDLNTRERERLKGKMYGEGVNALHNHGITGLYISFFFFFF
jgi:hypothetical protein